jgi:hypothetical protein
MRDLISVLISFAITVLLLACVVLDPIFPTKLKVTSNPVGADVVLEKYGFRGTTDGVISIPSKIFQNELKLTDEIVFSKVDYRTKRVPFTMTWGRINSVPTQNMEPLNTTLRVDSTPAGVRVTIKPKLANSRPVGWLPEGWLSTFTTPAEFRCTETEAKKLGMSLLVVGVEREGYTRTGQFPDEIIPLVPGKRNAKNILMQPIITTLRVETTPPGVIVEDIMDGGFGYLGETPLIHNFNWQDVHRWSARQEVERGDDTNSKVYRAVNLTLRLSKAGYANVFLENIRVPVGETRSYRKELKLKLSRINFASDPPGVHVYVKREVEQEIYDPQTKEIIHKTVTYKKHLGTTPFTLQVDPSDPLHHGELLIFEKPGFISSEITFAAGNDSYHQVMTPKRVMER